MATTVPLVLDADGLNAFAGRSTSWRRGAASRADAAPGRAGAAARASMASSPGGPPRGGARSGAPQRLHRRAQGAHTIVAAPGRRGVGQRHRRPRRWLPAAAATCSPASSGRGWRRSDAPEFAACLSVHLHGLAGELAAGGWAGRRCRGRAAGGSRRGLPAARRGRRDALGLHQRRGDRSDRPRARPSSCPTARCCSPATSAPARRRWCAAWRRASACRRRGAVADLHPAARAPWGHGRAAAALRPLPALAGRGRGERLRGAAARSRRQGGGVARAPAFRGAGSVAAGDRARRATRGSDRLERSGDGDRG
jgi:hypothetical protein